jgi:3-phosphoglycerate kinase
MKLRLLNNKVDVKDKVVFLRIDADVPVVGGKAAEGPNGRLERAAVGIEWLRQRGAKVVVLGHRGRPDGKRVPSLSLSPAVKRLEQLLGCPIKLSKQITGPQVERAISKMVSGDILILENVRFLKGETENDRELAKYFAGLANLYVNDAFATSHRAHMSVDALARLLPSYAGLELQRELDVLSKILKRPRINFLVVLGGKKIHTKIQTLEAFLKSGARVCVGGALVVPFYIVKDCQVGNSLYEKEDLPLAKKLLKKYRRQIILPEDFVTVRAVRKGAPKTISSCVDQLFSGARIVDLGPIGTKQFISEIQSAKTIVWNGPLGITEIRDFSAGTYAVVKKIAEQTGKAMTVVGGGDTIPIVDSMQLNNSFTLVSTGGGAMMAFLAGQKLPGIEALKSK